MNPYLYIHEMFCIEQSTGILDLATNHAFPFERSLLRGSIVVRSDGLVHASVRPRNPSPPWIRLPCGHQEDTSMHVRGHTGRFEIHPAQLWHVYQEA